MRRKSIFIALVVLVLAVAGMGRWVFDSKVGFKSLLTTTKVAQAQTTSGDDLYLESMHYAGSSHTFGFALVNLGESRIYQAGVEIQWVDSQGSIVASSSLLTSAIVPGGAYLYLSQSDGVVRHFLESAPSSAVLLRVVADPRNQIRESNENNNSREVRLDSNLVDYALMPPVLTSDYQLTLRVRNNGIVEADSARIKLQWVRRGGIVERGESGPFTFGRTILPGGEVTINPDQFSRDFLSHPPIDATHLRVTVDPENEYRELVEADNQIDVSLPLPDFAVNSARFTDEGNNLIFSLADRRAGQSYINRSFSVWVRLGWASGTGGGAIISVPMSELVAPGPHEINVAEDVRFNGRRTFLQYPYVPGEGVNPRLEISIDDDDRFSEENDHNNSFTIDGFVSDLVIGTTILNSQELSISVSNQGTKTMPAPINVFLRWLGDRDQLLLDYRGLISESIAPGGSSSFGLTSTNTPVFFSPTEFARSLRIIVHSDESFPELRAQNNSATINRPSSDISIRNAVITSSTVSFQVHNDGFFSPAVRLSLNWVDRDGNLVGPLEFIETTSLNNGRSWDLEARLNSTNLSRLIANPPNNALRLRINAELPRGIEDPDLNNNTAEIDRLIPDFILSNGRFRRDERENRWVVYYDARNGGNGNAASGVRASIQWLNRDGSPIGNAIVYTPDIAGNQPPFSISEVPWIFSFYFRDNDIPARAHSLRLRIDPENVITELDDERNNEIVVERPLPNLRVTSGWVGVDRFYFSFSSETDMPHQPVRLQWLNDAGAPVGSPLEINTGSFSFSPIIGPLNRVFMDGQARTPVGSGAGEISRISNFVANPPAGAARLKAIIDPADVYLETTEADNFVEVEPSLPDFRVIERSFTEREAAFEVVTEPLGSWVKTSPHLEFQWLNRDSDPINHPNVPNPLIVNLEPIPGRDGAYVISSRTDNHDSIRFGIFATIRPENGVYVRATVNPDGAIRESETNNNTEWFVAPLPDVNVVTAVLTESQLSLTLSNEGALTYYPADSNREPPPRFGSEAYARYAEQTDPEPDIYLSWLDRGRNPIGSPFLFRLLDRWTAYHDDQSFGQFDGIFIEPHRNNPAHDQTLVFTPESILPRSGLFDRQQAAAAQFLFNNRPNNAYYLHVVADPNNDTFEADEDNNDFLLQLINQQASGSSTARNDEERARRHAYTDVGGGGERETVSKEGSATTTAAKSLTRFRHEKETEEAPIGKPSILPGNPLYFLKEAGRGLRSSLTFNTEAKANLRLRFANEKLKEAEALAELGRWERLAGHMKNYEQELGRIDNLRKRLEQEKPEAAKNLNEKSLRANLRTQAIFGSLERDAKDEAIGAVKEARSRTLSRAGEAIARIGVTGKINQIVSQSLDTNDSPLKSFNSLEVLEALEKNLPASHKNSLDVAIEQHENRLEATISALPADYGHIVAEYAKVAPGDETNHLKVVDHISKNAPNEIIRNKLAVVEDVLVSRLEDRIKETKKKENAEAKLQNLKEGDIEDLRVLHDIETKTDQQILSVTEGVKRRAVENFENKLAKLGTADERKEFTEKTAEQFSDIKQVAVLDEVKDLLKEEKKVFVDKLKSQTISNIKDDIGKSKNAQERSGKIKSLLSDDAETLKAIKQNEKDFGGDITRELISAQVKLLEKKVEKTEYTHSIEILKQKIESDTTVQALIKQYSPELIDKLETKTTPVPSPTLTCPKDYAPVCGADGKTYTNPCLAEQAKTGVAYKGGCKAVVLPPPPLSIECPTDYKPVCGLDGKTYTNDCLLKKAGVGYQYVGECNVSAPPPPTTTVCTQEYAPVCGSDGKTYTNSCYAKSSGISIQYIGECKAVITAPPAIMPPQCSDGLDNDKDGYVDLKDPGCVDGLDNDETNSVTPPPPTVALLPDLYLYSPTISPSTPYAGDVLTFSAIAENIGSGSSGVSVARIRIDIGGDGKWDVFPSDLSVSAFGYGGLETKTWKSIWASTAGTHIFEICVDPDNLIKETDDNNNCALTKFSVVQKTVSPPPTISLPQCSDGIDNDKDGYIDLKDVGCTDSQDNDETNVVISPPPPPPAPTQPDYKISSLTLSPSAPISGNAVSVSATVLNIGGIGTGSSMTKLRIDIGNDGKWDVLPSDMFTDVLATNGSKTETWAKVWTATQGTHKFEVCADAFNFMTESNETNNCLTKTITVK